MMVNLGNFLFKVRNGLFPLLYVALFINNQLLFSNPKVNLFFGFILVLSGQAIRVLTVGMDYIVRGGRNRQVYANDLVQNGLFSLCRNPLYLGNLSILTGFGIASGSAAYLFFSMPLLYFSYACIIAAEESFLRKRFGEKYNNYCRHVPRLIPRLRSIMNFRYETFNWRRVVVKEYSTCYITFMVMLALSSIIMVKETSLTAISLPATLAVLATMACILIRYLKKRGILSGSKKRTLSR